LLVERLVDWSFGLPNRPFDRARHTSFLSRTASSPIYLSQSVRPTDFADFSSQAGGRKRSASQQGCSTCVEAAGNSAAVGRIHTFLSCGF